MAFRDVRRRYDGRYLSMQTFQLASVYSVGQCRYALPNMAHRICNRASGRPAQRAKREIHRMPIATDTLRVIELGQHLIGFYDGRVEGKRAFGAEPNWLDDGGYALGICSYAIYSGTEALVYDTHLSVPHAQRIRDVLSARGVKTIRVVLSHWHLDHIAGNAAFGDCEIIAQDKTISLLQKHRIAIESGELDGPPTISPLVMPTKSFTGEVTVDVGGVQVDLKPLDIHSCDGVALYLPHDGTLLAGDTLEDTVTYVDEPERLEVHLADLDRMKSWPFTRILPNHGSFERIGSSGYDRSLISATEDYVHRLIRSANDEALCKLDLRSFLGATPDTGAISYFAPYEDVHRSNILKIQSAVR